MNDDENIKLEGKLQNLKFLNLENNQISDFRTLNLELVHLKSL